MAEKKRTRWQRRPGTTGGKLPWNDWRNATTWRKATQLLLLAINIYNRFCEHSDFGMMMEETETVRHIFSSLYNVPDQIKEHYFKLKVIEIFLLLSVISTANPEKRSTYRKQQVDIVKAVSEYVSTQFMKRITIDSLSEQFDIPTSTLKRCFKGVFGTTIHQYLKECRINAAKRLLQDSDQSILEIANAVGYENGSKFTSAFKEATGVTPSAYRKV